MNVSRSNFQHTLPFIYECLRKSHFVALDFEMTGITAHPLLRNSNLDSVIFFISNKKPHRPNFVIGNKKKMLRDSFLFKWDFVASKL
jgi:CAF1 family ribonuclease.